MDYPVKYFHSAMRGAPVISGTAGSLLAMLDACLTTGFAVTSLTALTVADGIATATVNSGNSFEEGAVILIAGATPNELNGEARVLSASSTGFTFATAAADGAASGSITAKYAPADWWQKVYTGTNKAVWRSSDPQSNGHYLRIDDTGATYARVRGYESMTDVDTGNGPFPTDAQAAGGGYWHRSVSANATAVPWKLFGDSRALLLAVAPTTAMNATSIVSPARGFGDPITLRPAGDGWGTFISACGSDYYTISGQLESGSASSASGTLTAPRIWQGLGGSVAIDAAPYTGAANSVSGGDYTLGAFPSVIDGRLLLSQVFLREAGANPPRAVVPGVYRIPQYGATAMLTDGATVAASGALAGRRLVAVGTAIGTISIYNPPTGVYLVDATGPWR